MTDITSIGEITNTTSSNTASSKQNLVAGASSTFEWIVDTGGTLSTACFALEVCKVVSWKTSQAVDIRVIFPAGSARLKTAEESDIEFSKPKGSPRRSDEALHLEQHFISVVVESVGEFGGLHIFVTVSPETCVSDIEVCVFKVPHVKGQINPIDGCLNRVKVSCVNGNHLVRNGELSVQGQVLVLSTQLVVFVHVDEPELVKQVFVVETEVSVSVERDEVELDFSKGIQLSIHLEE